MNATEIRFSQCKAHPQAITHARPIPSVQFKTPDLILDAVPSPLAKAATAFACRGRNIGQQCRKRSSRWGRSTTRQIRHWGNSPLLPLLYKIPLSVFDSHGISELESEQGVSTGQPVETCPATHSIACNLVCLMKRESRNDRADHSSVSHT